MRQQLKLLVVIVAIVTVCSITSLITVTTVHAFQQLQSQNAAVVKRSHNALQTWMTLAYITAAYHIPLSTLQSGLHAHGITTLPNVSLHTIAASQHISDTTMLHTVQQIIDIYRQQTHPMHTLYPTPSIQAIASSITKKQGVFA